MAWQMGFASACFGQNGRKKKEDCCMKEVSAWLVAGLAIAVFAIGSKGTAGPEWELGEGSSMKLSFLGQVHANYVDGDEPGGDVLLRRARFILSGQVLDGVKFFVETDNDGAGRRGTSGVSTDIQDAFVDVRIRDWDHWVKAGLILLPFSFENRSSAASLLGNDYNSESIRFVNHFVWRDLGAELHGNCGKRFAYTVGAFDGYDGYATTGFEKNIDAMPRFTGHAAFNIIGDVQTGWFYSQNRLHKGPYLSVGVGVDRQDDATSTIDTNVANIVSEDAVAWVADLQSGYNIGDEVAVTVNAALYEWHNALFKGRTAFVESGVLFRDTMMTMKYGQARPFEEGPGFAEDYTVGLHYFLKEHNARAGLEYRWGTGDETALLGLQFLL